MNMKTLSIRAITVYAFVALIFLTIPATAQEMQRAYTDGELAKVREWEKTWAGKTVNHTNVDQVAPFLPEQIVAVIKNHQQWGAPPEGFSFSIRPYEFIPETAGFIAASKANSGKAKLAEDGSIENLADLAGRLFMDPGENAMKIAWNLEMQNRGDTFQYRKFSPNVNPKNRSERMADQDYWEYYFINRTELDPKPAVDNNPRAYRRGMFLHMFLPAEFLNTRMYTLRYIDQSKEDDSYLWYSQFRRIRRMNTAQRTDAIDGSDLIYDDEYLWDGQLLRNSYTYKGKKELLTDRHDGVGQITRNPGQVFSNGMTFERCNLLVIEAINKDKNYIYSKRVWYMDPETYYIMYTDIYDQQGRFWKFMFNSTQPLKSNIGEMKPVIVGSHFFDLQRTHGGIANQQKITQPTISDVNVTAEMFTTSYLQRVN
jgi:hypothetical protein